MKPSTYILLTFVLALFVNSKCEYQEGQRLIIRNNSEQEIIIVYSWVREIPRELGCLSPTTMAPFEYRNLINNMMIKPHSSRNFERIRLGDNVISSPNDTLYIGVFYRADIDAMSCEEFEQVFPLKKEWKVTLVDMQAADWNLVYTPEE